MITKSNVSNVKVKLIRDIIADKNNKIHAFLITSDDMRLWFANIQTTAGYILVTDVTVVLIIDSRYYNLVRNQTTMINVDEVVLVHNSYEKTLNELLAKDVRIANIGIESDSVTYSFGKRLAESVTATITPISIERLRLIKTKREIGIMKEAARINDKVYSYLVKTLKAGMTEKKVANMIIIKMLDFGADQISFPPIVASGINSAIPHHHSCNKIIEEGDLVVVDIGCILKGYHSDSTRTFAINKISNKLREIYNCVYDAQTFACDNVKMGMFMSEIDNLCRQHITRCGYGDYFTHGTGHGIGINVHEEPYVIATNNRDQVQNNIVFTIEPGIYIPNVGGVRIEDQVLILNGAVVLLQSTPKKLQILRN